MPEGGSEVHFYYDRDAGDNWVASRPDSRIIVLVGSLMSEAGGADWSPDNLKGWMKDPEGDNTYAITLNLPQGNWEYKVAVNESWAENYGKDGVKDGSNITLTIPAGGAEVTFTYDDASHSIKDSINNPTNPPGPEDYALVRPALQNPIQDEVFYFLLPDRFANGDNANNYGADPGGSTDADVLRHGFLATDKGYYHGGDIKGLASKLGYLKEMGVTAIWMAPIFKNRPVQGDGKTIAGSDAGYHGYWITDFTQIDPHFGSNQDLKDLIAAAHNQGIKVFFDIITNHTADVITYAENTFGYRNKEDYPYKDAEGNEFDDRDYVGASNFPPLDAATSFPYTPTFRTPADATVKVPAWLNNPIYYHNRGNSTFAGESSLYGDFIGLDDLFTEHPDVVKGMIDITKLWIKDFKIDGYRVDTVKHVNLEFWQAFAPEVMAYAAAQGIPDFFLFGEVFSSDESFMSIYTTEGKLPAVLDFKFQSQATSFAAQSAATDGLRDFFANDDYFTDADSNVYALPVFISNHDLGRLGRLLQNGNPSAHDAELTARSQLAHALMYFARGVPVVYSGDEQGFTGDGGDKDARQDMFPSQVTTYNDDDLIGTTATTADDNFDATHPIYTALGDYAKIYQDHKALRRGAQIHRYSSDAAGIYAFSRIDRDERVEYIVAFNNATTTKTATFPTFSGNMTFTPVFPANGSAITSTSDGKVTVKVAPIGYVVYKANAALPPSQSAPSITMTKPAPGADVWERTEIAATVSGNRLAEVTFAVKVGDAAEFTVIGTDNNPPYRVFYDVSKLKVGTKLELKAIVSDLNGHINVAPGNAIVNPPKPPASWTVIHYNRPDGDYDGWGLHLWGDGLDASEKTEWNAPKQWNGEDAYGKFAFIKVLDRAKPIGFIIHKGDDKDTADDRFFTPADTPEIWAKQGDGQNYTSPVAAVGSVVIHYKRPAGDYDGWGLHLWGDAIDPTEDTDWAAPKLPTGSDDGPEGFGVFFTVKLKDPTKAVNFIVHKGDEKDTPNDRSFIPKSDVWLQQDDATVYAQRGAVEDYAIVHYHRWNGDYDGWGMHLWAGSAEPGIEWTKPLHARLGEDTFGVYWKIRLTPDAARDGLHHPQGRQEGPGRRPIAGAEQVRLRGLDLGEHPRLRDTPGQEVAPALHPPELPATPCTRTALVRGVALFTGILATAANC